MLAHWTARCRKGHEVSNPGSRPRVNGIKLIVDCPYECPGHQTTIQTILKEKDNLQLLLLLMGPRSPAPAFRREEIDKLYWLG